MRTTELRDLAMIEWVQFIDRTKEVPLKCLRTLITAIIFGLLSAVLWGTSDFLSRETSKSIGYYLTTGYVQLIGFIVPISIALLYQEQIPIFDLPLLSLNLLLGIFVFLSFIFLYRGLSEGTMSIVAPVTSGSAPAFAVILFVIVLGQTLTKVETYAIAGVIVGVTLSGVRFSQLKKDILRTGFPRPNAINMRASQVEMQVVDHDKARRIVKGLDFSLLCSANTAVVYLGLGILIPRLGWFFPALILKGAAALVAFAFLVLARKKFEIPDTRTFLLLVLMGVLDMGGLLVFNYGISIAGNLLPLVVTFSGLSGLVILICAYVVYHERLERIQAVGIFLVITAASILLYLQ